MNVIFIGMHVGTFSTNSTITFSSNLGSKVVLGSLADTPDVKTATLIQVHSIFKWDLSFGPHHLHSIKFLKNVVTNNRKI